MRLNVHLHVLALDGVYFREEKDPHSPLVFYPLPTPARLEVAHVAERTAARIEKILRARGRSLEPSMADDEPHDTASDNPGLAACYAAAARGLSVSGDRAGQPSLRLFNSPQSGTDAGDADPDEPVAQVRGVNLYAKQRVDGRDRKQLERLCKYITRPPVAQDRLSQRDDGRLELTLKSPWRDGTRALLLEPHDLLTRLVAAVPPPRFHMLRYFGVLSSHSSLRAEVVPNPPREPASHAPPPAAGDQLELVLDADLASDTASPSRHRWGWLLKHVFRVDVDTCPKCGGAMRWLEAANNSEDAARLLAKHGLAPQPPPRARRQPVPFGQLRFRFGVEPG